MNRRTLARVRFARTSAEGGGGGSVGGAGAAAPAGDQTTAGTGANPPPADTGPVEATDPETGSGLGFPDKTPVEQMTDAQKAAYWRNQAKVIQKRQPSNLAEIQANAQKWAEFQQSQQTPADQALAAAREEARQSALKEAAEESVTSLMRVTLSSRGMDAAEVDELVEPVNAAKFLTQDGKVDTGKVTAFVNKIAPVGQAGGGNGFGQGRGFGQPPVSKAEAGRLEAERRRQTRWAPSRSPSTTTTLRPERTTP